MNAIPYEQQGRTGQKARTRAAIIDAAVELIERGEDATIDAAAALAGVGRGTAYRYFPNQRALLSAAHPWATADSLLTEDASGDPTERLRTVVGEITRMTRATEPALRTMLRLSLEGADTAKDLPLRKGRRLVWVSEALAPLADALDPAKFEALTLALAATCGIEVHVWLTDVAGLDPDGAADVMRWIADLILTGAVDEDAPDPPSSGAAMQVVRSRLDALTQVHGRAARSSQ